VTDKIAIIAVIAKIAKIEKPKVSARKSGTNQACSMDAWGGTEE